MLQGWLWWRNWVVDAMTGGGGRCLRGRKAMAGGGGTTETNKIDSNENSPDSYSGITEKPSDSPKITKLPQTPTFEFDFYTQARKALSFRSPFDSEDSPAPPVSVSTANTLPSGFSQLLSRHSDGRKRHKKSHSGSEKKSSTPWRPRVGNIWVETEEYFRELTVEDVDRLDPVSVVGFSGVEKCFLIPSLDANGTLCARYDVFNRMLASACEKDGLNVENGLELVGNGKVEVEETVVQEENEPHSMDVDCGEGEINELEIKEENNGEKKPNGEKDFTSFSGVEWLLGSRKKIYLASERPSKKWKLRDRNGGLEKLLVARPVEGLDSVCHYCSYGDMGNPLNCLIKCGSCGMVVHQRCYGVQEDVDSSWLCSWCKLKNDVGLSTERPCLLCPKQDGALKPVRKRGFGSENEGSEVEFAHLFCCQWTPGFYLENTRTMEPIMNLDELKDTRRNLTCCLCKVKCGACVWCSNGACRTSFHPICAREARHRMEIWGNLGCDEVELHAFCSKHSEVQDDSCNENAGDISLTADVDLSKLNDIVLDGEDITDKTINYTSHPETGDDLQPADKVAGDSNDNEDANARSDFDFTVILKKLINLGKVDPRDVASEIGVSPDSLNKILTDNHMVPEVKCKLVKWLKNHAYIGSLQKPSIVKIGLLIAPKAEADVAEGAGAFLAVESDISDAVPIKSVPPHKRTKSNIRIVIDDKSCSSMDKTNDGTQGDGDLCLHGGEDSNSPCREPLPDVTKKIFIDPEQHQDNSVNDSLGFEGELLRALARCLSEDVGETKQLEQMTTRSHVLPNGEVVANSYVHPFIYSKLMQTKNYLLEKTACYHSVGFRDQEVSELEASSSTGLCCNNHNLQATSGVDLDKFVKERNLDKLKLSPADEVEGELMYYQQRLLCNAVARKRTTDDLISKVVKRLSRENDAAEKRKWDAVLVSHYNHELREAKKQGRKERRHKEAQAVLAAATAAAAASSRIPSIRKDTIEESAHQEDQKMNVSDVWLGVYSKLNPRVKETISRSAVSRPSLDTNSDLFQLASDFSKEHSRTCDVCRRFETILNPILVCSSCKVAVHLDCYCSVKSSTGPWNCELCEDLYSSQGSGALATNSWEKPYFVAECGLCGGTAGAFRKSVDGQWIHALCAEWVLESTFRRGQVSPIERMETVCKGIDACIVCRRKQGACLKCSYGHCQSTFHPTCARSAGFYMTVRTNGGKLQHKAYCEKHSLEQRAKADTERHGIEELKSLKQVRVELERLRLLCERIIKREKLKRELVLCSHDILASSRDSVLSALARHPFYRPDVSSETATTSTRGYTDGYKSGSETVQRSDDTTVDSTFAGKRRVRFPMSVDNDRKTDDSSTSQNINKPSFSGKRMPKTFSVASQNLSDNIEKQSTYRKHSETLAKELIMTSDQASIKNQRLPKGYVYVPIRSLPKEKESDPDACSDEPEERNG